MRSRAWGYAGPFSGLVLVTVFVSSAALAGGGKIWSGHRAEFEKFLTTAAIVSVEELGKGVNQPKKVTLEKDGVTRVAVWKPIQRGPKAWAWESYQAEVAAWEMDQMLGLDMVPPTVLREIDGVKGSLQLWVDGVRPLSDIDETPPDTEQWDRQMERVACFDNLISNWARKPSDILVDEDWNVVLIDHSQAFLSSYYLNEEREKWPHKFDREFVEQLEDLDLEYLRFRFGRLLLRPQVDAIIKRRDALFAHLEELVGKNGAEAVFFESASRKP